MNRMYSIGEVCRLLGIKPHVLRYWEHEIPFLSPKKNRTGRRVYSQRDVQTLLRLKHLLYERKYTLRGARERFWEELGGRYPDIKSRLAEIRGELIAVVNRVDESRGRLDPMSVVTIIDRLKAKGQNGLFVGW